MTDIALITSALLVGVVIGLTGIGGGSLMTPLLILVFKITPPVAVATDLLFAAATKAVGTFEYARKRLVDWKIASLLWLGSLPASAITILLMPINGNFAVTMQRVLSFALLLTGLVILMRPLLHRRVSPGFVLLKLRAPLLVGFGVLLGVLVTLSSVGAGAIGLALLAVMYPDRRMTELVAVDLTHTVILCTIAGIGHFSLDHVDLTLLGKLLIGSIPGVWLGARLNWHINEFWIAIVLLAVGGWLWYVTVSPAFV